MFITLFAEGLVGLIDYNTQDDKKIETNKPHKKKNREGLAAKV